MADLPLATALTAATERLAAASVPSPRWDAEQLAALVAGVHRAQLATVRMLTAEQAARLADLVTRRCDRVPLQHLVGSVGFRRIDLEVGSGVFIPRPETELVAGFAVERARAAGPRPVVVDLCSGSGAIALAVASEVPDAQVHAVEVDPVALRWLTRNADLRHAAGAPGIGIHLGDARQALPELDGRVDVVVSNPPYVASHELAATDPEVRDHDPRVALLAGEDGLEVIRGVVASAERLLKPGGWVVIEHSDRQGESVPALLRERGWGDVADNVDLTGRPRCAVGRRSDVMSGRQVTGEVSAVRNAR